MGKKRKPTKDGKEAPRDLDPTGGKEMGVQTELPRKFRQVLAHQKFSKARKESIKKQETKLPERKPGESLADYNKRVDDSVRSLVNAAAKSTSKTRQKKKEWLTQRKAKANSKCKGEESDEEEKRIKEDKIKFGTVAMQPPSITAVPKQRGGNAAAIAALRKLEASREESSKTQQSEETADNTIGRKRKLKTLPEVERIAITNERAKAIAHYRAIKAAQKDEPMDDVQESE